MIGRIVVSGIFIACVVSFVVGIVAAFSTQPSRDKSNVDNKSIKALCSTASEKMFCHNVLNKTHGEDPREYVKAAIQATLEGMNSTVDLPNDIISRLISNNNTDAKLKMSLEDCNGMLESSVGYLQDVTSLLSIHDPRESLKRSEDIQQKISAVVASQESCFDEVEDPDLMMELKNGMRNATKLSHNAMAVVARMKEVYKVMGILLNVTDTSSRQKSRRLLGIEKDGFPTWISAADRRILAWHETGKVKPHAVVAKDGSGRYKTISEALAAYPEKHRGRYIVYVKKGIYKEVVAIEKRHKNVFMYGDGPTKTIVEGNRSSSIKEFSILQTATFSVSGEGFLCKSIGFINTAGPSKRHAVALRTNADFGMYYNCRIEGYQGTLHIQNFRQFFRNCLISGTVDMIFGQGTAVIQNTEIVVRWYSGQSAAIIAHGRVDPNQPTGIVLHNCIITPEKKLYPVRFNIKTFLGRAWKAYSRAIVMESILADFVQPQGWHEWDTYSEYTETCYFGEYNNRGLGAKSLNKRVQWEGFVKMNEEDALKFTVENFIQGKSWIPGRGVPHMDGLLN